MVVTWRSPTTYAIRRGHGSGRVREVEATLHRETHELHAVVHLQLAEDVLHVVLHGAVRQEERRRYLLVTHACRDVLEDLGLAVGQLVNRSLGAATADGLDAPELPEHEAGQTRGEDRIHRGGRTHGCEELLAAGRLQEVAERARLDRSEDVLVVP